MPFSDTRPTPNSAAVAALVAVCLPRPAVAAENAPPSPTASRPPRAATTPDRAAPQRQDEAADRPVPVTGAVFPAAALVAARKGDAAVRANDFSAAARAYALAAEAAPEDAALRLALGVALSAARRTDLALPQFRRAVRLAEDDVVAHLLLRTALAERGLGAEAQQLELDVYRRFSRPDGRGGGPGLNAAPSVRRLTAALARLPESPVLRLLLGDAHSLAGEYARADAAYQEAHRRAPLWSKPLVNGGLSLLAQDKSDGAIRAFADALRVEPGNAQALANKGEAEMRAGRNAEAIATLGRVASARDIAPNLRAQAGTNLGIAFANARRFDKAEDALSAAQRLAPADPVAAAALGDIKQRAGDYKGAAGAYDTALSLTRAGGLFAARPFLYRALAEAQLSARQPDEAMKTLRRAMAEEPESAPLWHRLNAQALSDLGRPDAALDALCAALDLEPNVYPLDTLNALAARDLLARVRERYRRDLDIARTGFSVRGGGSAVSISNVPSASPVSPAPPPGVVGAGYGGARAASAFVTPPIPAPSGGFGGALPVGRAFAPTAPTAPTAGVTARALAALASVARFEGRTADEVALRRQLADERGTAADWFQLADVYDLRADRPRDAEGAYRKALTLDRASGGVTASKSGGLTETQRSWARARLEKLTAAGFRP